MIHIIKLNSAVFYIREACADATQESGYNLHNLIALYKIKIKLWFGKWN